MTRDEIFETLRENILYVLPELDASRITREESLRDLGANSVDRADIITETTGALKIRVRLADLGGLKNIGELVDFLHAQSA